MGFWKTAGHVMLIKGAIVTGYFLNSGHKDVEGFELRKDGHEVVLYSESLGKGYEINVMDNEVYVGNAEHQYQGMRALTNYELVFEDIPLAGAFAPEPSLLETLTDKAESIFRGNENERL